MKTFLVESGREQQRPETVSGSKRQNYKERRAERPGGHNVQCGHTVFHRRKPPRVQGKPPRVVSAKPACRGNCHLWGLLSLLACRSTVKEKIQLGLPSRE